MEITDWDLVPDGTRVIEDTYNEIYEVFTKDGYKWLRQVGWQVGNRPILLNEERPCDFDPACMYDQPWYTIGPWGNDG